MISLETRIGQAIDRIPLQTTQHPELASALEDLREITKRQKEDLQSRLQKVQLSSMTGRSDKAGKSRGQTSQTHSAALRGLHGHVNEAALGYAMMHAVAHRFYDSKEEGNTADLAEKHLRAYSHASQVLNRLISDVTVWELSNLGQECRCQCPSCGLGICLCSPHGTNTVGDVWREAAAADLKRVGTGMRVRPPRSNSAASRVGLHAGDIVLTVDGRDLLDESWDSIRTIQDAVGKHKSGEIIRFRVLHATGATEEVSFERP